MPPRRTFAGVLTPLLLALALAAAGCGQKGDLYHPDDPPPSKPDSR